ncbi:hypothetical protein VTJ49DRAFT_3270 [Mycothermus thermophilus]|uniref:Protein kinase domain-containing protein n=1 Tax=Humicola insolens TaxID=85995 RepID=A0ABR3V9W3_HUMIN
MHSLEILQSGGYRHAGLTRLKLSCLLTSFPPEILELGDTLEELDLSDTGISQLPSNLSTALPNLKTIILDRCNFTTFPVELATCPALETIVLRSNNMTSIPENAFPPTLRCLVLTDNRLTRLPKSISRCQHLRSCMLVANQLRTLPRDMASCKELTELRLSCNRLRKLPHWLFTLPKLAFLSFASNPCAAPMANGYHKPKSLSSIPWSELEVRQPPSISSPASTTYEGLWHQSPHYAEDVTVTLFRGGRGARDEGCPADELAAYLAAGAHEGLVAVLGLVEGHPDEENDSLHQGGIVTQVVPEGYVRLGQEPVSCPPPPMVSRSTSSSTSSQQQQSTAREEPPSQTGPARLPPQTILELLTPLAGALAHLHERGISHGALAPHNVLASVEDRHALLDGFGAATVYAGLGKANEAGDRVESDNSDEEEEEDDDGEEGIDEDPSEFWDGVGGLVERVEERKSRAMNRDKER